MHPGAGQPGRRPPAAEPKRRRVFVRRDRVHGAQPGRAEHALEELQDVCGVCVGFIGKFNHDLIRFQTDFQLLFKINDGIGQGFGTGVVFATKSRPHMHLRAHPTVTHSIHVFAQLALVLLQPMWQVFL